MKKVLFLLLLCASSSWATFSGYTYRREVSIEQENVSTQSLTLANFPVLLSTTDITLSTSASGGHMQTAYDLVFSTMQDCSFLLDWDTETVNNTGSAPLNVWVNIPVVSSNTDIPFFMCYGNSGTTSYQGNSALTWDSNFAGVWHMNAPASPQPDSTINGGVAVSSFTGASVLFNQTGEFSPAVGFKNGIGNFLYVTTMTALSLEGSAITVYMVIESTYTPAAGARVLNWSSGAQLAVNAATNPIPVRFNNGGASVASASNISNGTWCQIAVTNDKTNTFFWKNGNNSAGQASTSGSTASTSLMIGGSSISSTWSGYIDELEISKIVRSYGWIQTEYNNQFSPSTFAEIGPETQTGTSGVPLLQVQGGQMLIQGGQLLVQ